MRKIVHALVVDDEHICLLSYTQNCTALDELLLSSFAEPFGIPYLVQKQGQSVQYNSPNRRAPVSHRNPPVLKQRTLT